MLSSWSDCSSQLIFSLERVTDSLYFPVENRGFSVLSDLISVFFVLVVLQFLVTASDFVYNREKMKQKR